MTLRRTLGAVAALAVAAAARAQEAPPPDPVPPAAPAPPGGDRPAETGLRAFSVSLPLRSATAGDSAEATASHGPGSLMSAEGFLLALPAVPPGLRAASGRVWRVTGAAEELAALRITPETPQEELARIDDDRARRLLALDLDARAPDAAGWLGRIDPVHCSVRVRVRGDLPPIPAAIELLELVADAADPAAAPPPLVLPDLPRARRVAAYGFALEGDAASKFREAHPRALLVTSLREPWDAAVAGCDAVRVRAGGARPRVVDLATGAAATGTLLKELEIEERVAGAACPCALPDAVEFLRGGRIAARVRLHSTAILTWEDGAWPGDVRVRVLPLLERIEKAGIARPAALHRERIAADARRTTRDARQDAILGRDEARALRERAADEPPALPADVAVLLRLAGCAGGERDDAISAAVVAALAKVAPAATLPAATAHPDDAELQRGFALWLWDLPDRSFLVEEEKPLLGRTAQLLAKDEDPEVRVAAVRAARELGLVAVLRDLLTTGPAGAPHPSQVQAAFALVDLGDASSEADIRKLLDASDDPFARASLEAALQRAKERGEAPR